METDLMALSTRPTVANLHMLMRVCRGMLEDKCLQLEEES